MFRAFFDYDQRRKDCSYVKGTITPITSLDAYTTTVVHIIVEKEGRVEQHQPEYPETIKAIV